MAKKTAKRTTASRKTTRKIMDNGVHIWNTKVIVIEAAVLAAIMLIGGVCWSVFSHWQTTNTVSADERTVEARKFAEEYPKVADDNVFVYRDSDEIVKILEHGTGVVFLGFPDCPWCQAYAPYLNEVAKEVGIDTIYYHNIFEDRKNNTTDYQKMVSLLSGRLQYNNEGQEYIYVPDVAFVVDGVIVANDYESSKDTAGLAEPAAYWTEARVVALKARLKDYMQLVKDAQADCTDTCNE